MFIEYNIASQQCFQTSLESVKIAINIMKFEKSCQTHVKYILGNEIFQKPVCLFQVIISYNESNQPQESFSKIPFQYYRKIWFILVQLLTLCT